MWVNLARFKVSRNWQFSKPFPPNTRKFKVKQSFLKSPPIYRSGEIALAQWAKESNSRFGDVYTPQIYYRQLLEWKQDNEVFIFVIPNDVNFTNTRLAITGNGRYLRNNDFWIVDVDYWDSNGLAIDNETLPLLVGII